MLLLEFFDTHRDVSRPVSDRSRGLRFVDIRKDFTS